MKKSYKIEVDCAGCANNMEQAVNKTKGVKSAIINFMAGKLNIDFEDDADINAVMAEVIKNCKKIESDCEIYI
ncbi:MAG: heavy metal-associated domain-containing protein [Monoglobales bacterium]